MEEGALAASGVAESNEEERQEYQGQEYEGLFAGSNSGGQKIARKVTRRSSSRSKLA